MIALSLNPGFALLLGAVAVLAAPQRLRAPLAALSGVGAFLLLFAPDFGEHAQFAQIGVTLVPLRLDALSQTFGLLYAIVVLILAVHGADGRERAEEAALLTHAGGALTAVFAGDFVSFTAAAELSFLAGAALLFLRTDSGAQAAGLRMLGAQAIGATALLAGAAFVIADSGGALMARIPLASPAGVLIGVALAVKVGAPIAHLWLRDAAARASTAGAAALLTFTPALGVYGALRLFSGEPALVAVGLAGALFAALYALTESHLFRSLGYAAAAQAGLALCCAGIGSPLAFAGAAGQCFTGFLALVLLTLAVGEARDRTGGETAQSSGGLWRPLPFSAGMALFASLSLAGMPFMAGYASLSLLFGGLRAQGLTVQLLAIAAVGVSIAHSAVKPAYVVFMARPKGKGPAVAVFSAAQLSMVVAAALLVGVGAAPAWLYGFLPSSPPYLAPFDADRVMASVQTGTIGALAVFIAVALRSFPAEPGRGPRDVDYWFRRARATGAAHAENIARTFYAHWRELERRVAAGFGNLTRLILSRAEGPSRALRLEPIFFLALLTVCLLLVRFAAH